MKEIIALLAGSPVQRAAFPSIHYGGLCNAVKIILHKRHCDRPQ